MNIQRILCPIDFSDSSTPALKHASAFATRIGASITVLHVVEPIIYPVEYGMAPVPMVDLETTATNNARDQLERLAAESVDKSVTTDIKVVFGRAAEQICEEAENGFDVIILATHGRTGFKHLLLGSVAERVVRLAPCPVLTVKGGD